MQTNELSRFKQAFQKQRMGEKVKIHLECIEIIELMEYIIFILNILNIDY
jgi:hypothetical protein